MPILKAHAPAIHCEGCANSIKRSLGKLPGVENVDVEVPEKNVVVQYDGTQSDANAIYARLEAAGFPASPVEGEHDAAASV